MMDIFRPLLDPQPIEDTTGMTYKEVQEMVWRRHKRHHIGCIPPVATTLLLPWFWPLAPFVFTRACLQHREDYRRSLLMVQQAADPRRQR